MRALVLCIAGILLGNSCQDSQTRQDQHFPAAKSSTGSTVKPTAIRSTGSGYELLRYGKPYFIEGAGGVRYFDRLKACGGNSIRVWDDNDADRILNEAQRLGLTVMLGLWVERESEGFDYDNAEAIDRQRERIRKIVLKYRNHPALLMWCAGNEVGLHATNLKTYDELNRIIQLVHSLDDNHPVTTALSLDSSREVWLLRERCPDLDILSVNVYADIAKLPQMMQEGGWTGPYIFSEYGAKGFWGESGLSPWVTPIEPSSEEKASFVRQVYHQHIAPRPPKCLGAYLFYWGNKQEETSTWFSLFDEQDRETSMVGLMQELWSGKVPANKAPIIETLRVNGKVADYQQFKASSALQTAEARTRDPEGDSLTYYWEIKPQAQVKADFMGTPMPALGGLIRSAVNRPTLSFRLPAKPGPYRLFVFAYDNHRHVATANLTFLVTE